MTVCEFHHDEIAFIWRPSAVVMAPSALTAIGKLGRNACRRNGGAMVRMSICFSQRPTPSYYMKCKVRMP